MNDLLDALKRSKVIVDYQTCPASDGDPARRLTIWVDPMVTEMALSDLLQAVVDQSVETDTSWDVWIGIVVERATISQRANRASDDRDRPRK